MEVDNDINPVDSSQWPSMTAQQLEKQRDILHTRINMIMDMGTNNPSIKMMYDTLLQSINYITNLIEIAANKGKYNG